MIDRRRPRGHPAAGALTVIGPVLLAAACAPPHAEPSHVEPYIPAEQSEIHAKPPEFTEGMFPCSECHYPEDVEEMPFRLKRRRMTIEHKDIVLAHDEEHRWCLDCHDAVNRDMLHLASGELVPFEESYRLCGQCHGDKYRDWRAGVHGRRTGHWDGEKEYLLCVHCHDSHHPAFEPIRPLPAPRPPQRTR